MSKIQQVSAVQILDSRGDPTIQVTVLCDDSAEGSFGVPSGASKGKSEAWELRDNIKEEYNGKGVNKAIGNVNNIINQALKNLEVQNQKNIDNILIELDGTSNKSKLGANAIIGTSIACAKAAAKSRQIPFWKYIAEISANTPSIPICLMNMIEGGKHTKNNLSIQEFLIIPKYSEVEKAYHVGLKFTEMLEKYLQKLGYGTPSADEGGVGPSIQGGFGPNIADNNPEIKTLQILASLAEKAEYEKKVNFALDVAASSGDKKFSIPFYQDICQKFPINLIEDPYDEEDWENWQLIQKKLSYKVRIIGDDIFTTNPGRLKKGIRLRAAGGVIIKPNQIGTLAETIRFVHIARQNNFATVVSHRSGETLDSSLSDIAVGLGAQYLKSGNPTQAVRAIKYKRLMQIQKELAQKF